MSDLTEFVPGECRFCSQMHSIAASFENSDEQATRQCGCDEAKDYQVFLRVIDKIENLFDDEDIVKYVQEQARLVHGKLVMGVTVEIEPGVKVKINRTTKNKLKIKRTDTEVNEVEA